MCPPAEPRVPATEAALGLIPYGRFLLSVTGRDRRPSAALVTWVQRAGRRSPMVTVALEGGPLAPRVAEAGRFTLSRLADGETALARHFGRTFGPGEDPFEGVETRHEDARGGPVPAEALGYLDARVVGEVGSDGLRVFLAEVVGGAAFGPARAATPGQGGDGERPRVS